MTDVEGWVKRQIEADLALPPREPAQRSLLYVRRGAAGIELCHVPVGGSFVAVPISGEKALQLARDLLALALSPR